MAVDKACDNKICMKSDECARYEEFVKGDKNYKTFRGSELKACGQFIQK
ncbi:MAG: hypothetical protein U9P72_08190 [Campylobacterota bacterium]|nr:hypothetical protein [Campylobacterota bacterium]